MSTDIAPLPFPGLSLGKGPLLWQTTPRSFLHMPDKDAFYPVVTHYVRCCIASITPCNSLTGEQTADQLARPTSSVMFSKDFYFNEHKMVFYGTDFKKCYSILWILKCQLRAIVQRVVWLYLYENRRSIFMILSKRTPILSLIQIFHEDCWLPPTIFS